MSRVETNQSSASHEIKNNISKVTIEPEKLYGIYLPDWQSVVHAVHTFTSGDFQMAPLSKEEVRKEKALRAKENADPLEFNQYTNVELNLLNKLYSKKFAQPEEVDKALHTAKNSLDLAGRAAFYSYTDTSYADLYDNRCNAYDLKGGFALYGKVLTLELLERKEHDREDSPKYTSPYLLTTFSGFFEDTGEAKLAEELGQERLSLPRNVIVSFGREEGDTSRIDFDDIAAKLNKGLQINESGKNIADALESEKKKYSLGVIDGLEVKMTPSNAYTQERKRNTIAYTDAHEDAYLKLGIEYHPVALELSIADPALESRAYGSINVVPPEKRAKAQRFAEKIRDVFST